MQALVIFGFLFYYATVATAFNWFLRKNSLWFTTFLAIVVSQTVAFGGDYVYRGYWESWNTIALVTSSAMCIAVSVVVALVFRHRKSSAENAPT
jgi:amino acid transporter